MTDEAKDADLTAEKQQQELIKKLAAMPEPEAVKAIEENANRDVGKYGSEAVAAAERNLAHDVAQYKKEHGVYVNGYADVLVRKEGAVTVGADASGVQNTTFSRQTDIGKIGDVSFLGGTATTVNTKGELTSGSAWVNGAGPAYDLDVAKVIPVGQLKVDVQPNSPLNAGNVSAMVGAVINPDATKNNVAVLLGGTLDANNLNLTVNDSQDFNLSKNSVITGNAGLTQDLLHGKTAFSVGGRYHEKDLFSPTTGGALEIGASQTLGNKFDPNIMVKVSVTSGNTVDAGDSPLEKAFMKATGKDHTESYVPNQKVADANILIPSAPPKEQPIQTAAAGDNYIKHADVVRANAAASTSQTAADKTINLAQEENRLFKLTRESFVKGVNEAADFHNGLPNDELKAQFRHDFAKNLAPLFNGNIKAADAYTSEEFASREKYQQQQLAMAPSH